MPPVIIAAVAAYAGWITAAQFILTVVAYGIGQYQASRARRKARDAYNNSLQDRMVMTATVDQPRTRCYGRVRNVDGIVFKGTWGDKKQFYTLIISLCGHEIDGVEKVMFSDTVLTLDELGQVQDAPWLANESNTKTLTVPPGPLTVTLPELPIAGSVVAIRDTSGLDLPMSVTVAGSVVTFPAGSEGFTRRLAYQVSNGRSHAVVTLFNGGASQDISYALVDRFPDLIQSGQHRFAGMACLMVELAYSQDAFPNGVPNPITAIFRGAKILDPRTGVTAWSENPALIARDWSLYANGGGRDASELVSEDFIAAANACDVPHNFKSVNGDGDEVITTRPMYTCGIVCSTAGNPLESLEAICESMAGDFAWPGGRLSIRAGAYTLPVGTINGDWLNDKAAIEMVKDAPRADLINIVTPTIANAANRHIVAPIPRIVADAYVAADGEEYPAEVSFEGVTDSDHAAHIASVMLKDARASKTYTLPCNLRGLQVKVGQNWTVDLPEFGLSSEVMRCVGWRIDFEKSATFLTFKATSAAIFDPDAEFLRDDALPNSSLPNPFSVPQVSGIVIESGTSHLFVQSDGTVVTRVLVKWDLPDDEAVLNSGTVEVRYGTFDKSFDEWQSVTVGGSESQVYLSGLEDTRVYAFILRFKNRLVTGPWGLTQSHLVIGKSAPPAMVAGLAANRVLGALVLTRTPSTEADWANTIYEYSTNGGASYNTIRAVADRSGATWTNPVTGALKIRARDIDTSSNAGPISASIDVTVLPDDLGDGASTGDALNGDPYVLDASRWVLSGTGLIEFRVGPTTEPGARGGAYMNVEGAGERWAFDEMRIPVDPSRTYNLVANVLAAAGNNRNMYGVVRMFKADGTELSGADTGWGGTFAGYVFGGLPPTGQFTIQGGDFGAGASGRPIPPSVSTIQIGVWFQYAGEGSGAVRQSAQFIRLTDVTGARAASAAAAAAASAAATANSNATSALSTLSAMRSNGVLDASEKPAIIREWLKIQGERTGIVNQANDYGIGTERDNYTYGYDQLATYLSGLSPAWNDTTLDTPITPTTDQGKWSDFYNARQALLNKISDAAGDVANWTGVSGRPKNFMLRAYGRSAGSNAPWAGGLINGDTGSTIGAANQRSFIVAVLNRDGTHYFSRAYDIWGDGAIGGYGITQLAGDLNYIATASEHRNKILTVRTHDEPWTNHTSTALLNAMLANGASRAIYERRLLIGGAYCLVAVCGAGEGNGAEVYGGDIADDPDAWCELAFQISAQGALIVSGETSGARSLTDYGYLGSMDATTNKVFVQSTDPAPVPDGTIWINTSTGKAYQRTTSGTWQPYVGSGSVGTGELGAGAATGVNVARVAGPTSVTANQTVPNNLGAFNLIASLVFVPSAIDAGNIDVMLYVSGNWSISTTTFDEVMLGFLGRSTAYDGFAVTEISDYVPPSSGGTGSFVRYVRLSVPGNVSTTFGFWAQRFNNGTCSLSNVELRAEVIKR